jgi:hypothetical protein
MTTSTFTHSAIAPLAYLGSSINGFFRSLAQAVAVSSGAQNRFDRIQTLNALSDAELAERGLARDEIVQHVFRDFLDA